MKKMLIKSSQEELKVELERSPTIPMNCPLDVTALGHSNSDLKTFEEALDYEINQLQKLGTWVMEDLPTGQKPYHAAKS